MSKTKKQQSQKEIESVFGKRFGCLVVDSLSPQIFIKEGKWQHLYFCYCDCGEEVISALSDLESGKRRTCPKCELLSRYDSNFQKRIGKNIKKTLIALEKKREADEWCYGRKTVAIALKKGVNADVVLNPPSVKEIKARIHRIGEYSGLMHKQIQELLDDSDPVIGMSTPKPQKGHKRTYVVDFAKMASKNDERISQIHSLANIAGELDKEDEMSEAKVVENVKSDAAVNVTDIRRMEMELDAALEDSAAAPNTDGEYPEGVAGEVKKKLAEKDNPDNEVFQLTRAELTELLANPLGALVVNNEKDADFVMEYMRLGNVMEALRVCGYASRAILDNKVAVMTLAKKIMRRPEIIAAVAWCKQQQLDDLVIGRDEYSDYLTRIIRGNVGDMLNDDGLLEPSKVKSNGRIISQYTSKITALGDIHVSIKLKDPFAAAKELRAIRKMNVKPEENSFDRIDDDMLKGIDGDTIIEAEIVEDVPVAKSEVDNEQKENEDAKEDKPVAKE